jgi:hypothetical protein
MKLRIGVHIVQGCDDRGVAGRRVVRRLSNELSPRRRFASHVSRASALKVFDVGGVQANGFQINADATPSETVTESGASYMAFAASSLLAGRPCAAAPGSPLTAFSRL